jgi:hypothetical protein|tara:strand:- start:555 stop:773 length:219 start_codon:yes stop_codon:yes gene_type:complete
MGYIFAAMIITTLVSIFWFLKFYPEVKSEDIFTQSVIMGMAFPVTWFVATILSFFKLGGKVLESFRRTTWNT